MKAGKRTKLTMKFRRVQNHDVGDVENVAAGRSQAPPGPAHHHHAAPLYAGLW